MQETNDRWTDIHDTMEPRTLTLAVTTDSAFIPLDSRDECTHATFGVPPPTQLTQPSRALPIACDTYFLPLDSCSVRHPLPLATPRGPVSWLPSTRISLPRSLPPASLSPPHAPSPSRRFFPSDGISLVGACSLFAFDDGCGLRAATLASKKNGCKTMILENEETPEEPARQLAGYWPASPTDPERSLFLLSRFSATRTRVQIRKRTIINDEVAYYLFYR